MTGCYDWLTSQWKPLQSIAIDKAFQGDPLRLLFLGAPQSGKTKLLCKFSDVDVCSRFPSIPNQLEKSNSIFSYMGCNRVVELSACTDSTVDHLVKAYINEHDVFVITYNRNYLEQLQLIERKYTELLGSHRNLSSISVMIVGTAAINNPYSVYRTTLLRRYTENIMLYLVVWRMWKTLGIRIGVDNVVVDDFSSTEKLKSNVQEFVYSTSSYAFQDFRNTQKEITKK